MSNSITRDRSGSSHVSPHTVPRHRHPLQESAPEFDAALHGEEATGQTRTAGRPVRTAEDAPTPAGTRRGAGTRGSGAGPGAGRRGLVGPDRDADATDDAVHLDGDGDGDGDGSGDEGDEERRGRKRERAPEIGLAPHADRLRQDSSVSPRTRGTLVPYQASPSDPELRTAVQQLRRSGVNVEDPGGDDEIRPVTPGDDAAQAGAGTDAASYSFLMTLRAYLPANPRIDELIEAYEAQGLPRLSGDDTAAVARREQIGLQLDAEFLKAFQATPASFFSTQTAGAIALTLLYIGINTTTAALLDGNAAAQFPVVYNLVGTVPQIVNQFVHAYQAGTAPTLDSGNYLKILGATMIEAVLLVVDKEPKALKLDTGWGVGIAVALTLGASLVVDAGARLGRRFDAGKTLLYRKPAEARALPENWRDPDQRVSFVDDLGAIMGEGIAAVPGARAAGRAIGTGASWVGSGASSVAAHVQRYFGGAPAAPSASVAGPATTALAPPAAMLMMPATPDYLRTNPEVMDLVRKLAALDLPGLEEGGQLSAEVAKQRKEIKASLDAAFLKLYRNLAPQGEHDPFWSKGTHAAAGVTLFYIAINVVVLELLKGNAAAQIPGIGNLTIYIPMLISRYVRAFQGDKAVKLDAGMWQKLLGTVVVDLLQVGIDRNPKGFALDKSWGNAVSTALNVAASLTVDTGAKLAKRVESGKELIYRLPPEQRGLSENRHDPSRYLNWADDFAVTLLHGNASQPLPEGGTVRAVEPPGSSNMTADEADAPASRLDRRMVPVRGDGN